MALGMLLAYNLPINLLNPYPINISPSPNWVFGGAIGFIFIGIRQIHIIILRNLPTKTRWLILLLFYFILVGFLIWIFRLLMGDTWG